MFSFWMFLFDGHKRKFSRVQFKKNLGGFPFGETVIILELKASEMDA